MTIYIYLEFKKWVSNYILHKKWTVIIYPDHEIKLDKQITFGIAIWLLYGDMDLGRLWLTKPLPEAMLTNHQQGLMALRCKYTGNAQDIDSWDVKIINLRLQQHLLMVIQLGYIREKERRYLT